ncbi:MAG: helix-turn-helix transcriptional regulator [Kibdelosporangium sp.]
MTSTLDRTATAELRRTELAAFLRSRRERITPEQVGLPPGGRRRTPGLRREEVAQIAGVGVTWYTWLEQGRDIKASDQVLDAIASTLRLDPHERAHMFTLAGSPQPVAATECKALSPAIHVILNRLEPLPTVVINTRMDILGYNRTYEWLFDLDEIPFEDRNAMVLIFTHPRWRERVVDWSHNLPRMVAQFRASMAEHVADQQWKCLVRKLRAESPEFDSMWDQHEVRGMENLTKRFLHPAAGLLEFDYTHLWFGARSETRLTSYTPSTEDTWAKINASAPG